MGVGGISSAGRLIPLESSKYVWLGDIYKGAGVAAVRDQCKIFLPLSTHSLTSLVTYHRPAQIFPNDYDDCR